MDPESFRNFVSELGEAIEWANTANSATDTVEVGMIGMGVIASWSSAGSWRNGGPVFACGGFLA